VQFVANADGHALRLAHDRVLAFDCCATRKQFKHLSVCPQWLHHASDRLNVV
jgi:hypothetical protein